MHLDSTGMLERRGYSDSLDDEIGPARLSLPSWDPGVVRRLDPGQSARQRIEFLGGQGNAGDRRTYTWKAYFPNTTQPATTWFHIAQIKNGETDPLLALNIATDTITTSAAVCPGVICGSMKMSDFFDITTYHVLQVTFGPSGWFDYVITNAQTNEQLLETQHSAGNWTDGYVKHGIYRDYGTSLTPVDCYTGDFTTINTTSYTPST